MKLLKNNFSAYTLAFVGVAILITVFVPSVVVAESCGGIETAVLGCNAANSEDAIIALIRDAIKILTAGIGVLAVGAVIYGAILYSSAGGSPDNIKKAKTIWTNVVIGLALFAFTVPVVNFFIPGGVFGDQSTTVSKGANSQKNDKDGTASSKDQNKTSSTSKKGSSSSTAKKADDSSKTPEKKTNTVNVPVTIASWNTYYVNSPGSVANGVKAIADNGASLIGLQELNFANRRNAVKSKLVDCSGCKYSMFMPSTNKPDGWNTPKTVSLLWDKTMFDKQDAGSSHVSGPSSAANTGDKWINWVKLKEKKTGTIFYLVNTHLVAHVRKAQEGSYNRAVIPNYTNHINKLKSFVKSINNSNTVVIITGDFNINYNWDKSKNLSYSPRKALGSLGIQSNWELNGVKTGAIDYIWAPKRSDIKVNSTSLWSNKYGSDHKPVTLKLTLEKKK